MPTETKAPVGSLNPSDSVEDKEEVSSNPPGEATTPDKIDGEEAAQETSENAEASVSAEDDISEFLPQVDEEETKNIGMQKRIDKLTAKLREAEERLEEIQKEKTRSPDEKPRYTDEQLKGAIQKAMAEGDHDLMMDVIAYKVQQAQESLRDEYTQEKTKAQRDAIQAQTEWNEVVKLYGHFGNQKSEVYPGSSKELNVLDDKSKLRKLAEELWKDPKYHYYGGRKAAMTDALAIIMKKRTSAADNPVTMRLKNQLEKEKMKTAPVSGDSEGGSGETLKPQGGLLSPDDKLAQYVAERKSFREKADMRV